MNPNDYINSVVISESRIFDPDNVDQKTASVVFKTFIAASKAVDVLKRAYYYGKPLDRSRLNAAMGDANLSSQAYFTDNEAISDPMPGLNKMSPAVNPRIIHAAIGISTESGEILESVYNSLVTLKKFNYDNFYEELGDHNWYCGVGIDAGRTDNNDREWSFDCIWDANIGKLKARYPNKFETDRAFNRDLTKETEVLSQRSN